MPRSLVFKDFFKDFQDFIWVVRFFCTVYQIGEEIYQMAIKYFYIFPSFHGPPQYGQIGIFGKPI
jgi:hypothetical protein